MIAVAKQNIAMPETENVVQTADSKEQKERIYRFRYEIEVNELGKNPTGTDFQNRSVQEEPHFDIARKDLEHMGHEPLDCPLEVKLWWAYFDKVIIERPFVRLGATCVLENLGAGAGKLGHDLLDNAGFLNEKNTRFLQIHFHEELPHGDQIIEALEAVKINASEIEDLIEGARTGAVLYLRMARWAMKMEELTFQRFCLDTITETTLLAT